MNRMDWKGGKCTLPNMESVIGSAWRICTRLISQGFSQVRRLTRQSFQRKSTSKMISFEQDFVRRPSLKLAWKGPMSSLAMASHVCETLLFYMLFYFSLRHCSSFRCSIFSP